LRQRATFVVDGTDHCPLVPFGEGSLQF